MGLFSKNNKKRRELVSLSIHDEGIAIAHLTTKNSQFLLKALEYRKLDSPEEFPSQLSQLVKKLDLEGKPCSLVLRPSQYQLFLIDALNVSPSELPVAARWRAKEMIDYPLEQAMVSAFNVPPHGPGKQRKKTFVVACRTETIKPYTEIIEKALLNLQIIDIAELALRNLSLHYQQSSHPLALLHLKPGQSEIIILQDGDVFLTRNFDINTEGLTNLPEQDQQALLDALLLEVQRSYDYCDSSLSIPAPAQLVLTPQTKNQQKVADYLSTNLASQLNIIDISEIVACDKPIPAKDQALTILALGGCLRLKQDVGK